MDDVLRPLLVIGGTVALTLLMGWLIDRALRAADARHPETRLWSLLRSCQPPLQVLLASGAVQISYAVWELSLGKGDVVPKILATLTIASAAWLAIRAADAVAENTLVRYEARTEDLARVRQFRTQLTMLRRVVTTILAIVASAVAILLVFPDLRALGTSMLASAGVIGVIAGVAAQSMLGNLFAGLQIAFGESVKIGDTVVVDGEWGTVEELSLAFLTIRIWDDRRLTMPVSYFNSRPYENWSRGGHEITATVYLHLDHATPIPALRKRLQEFLLGRADWDGRVWSLVVTDSTPTTIQVRAAMSAKDSGDAWTLRCAVREELIAWLRDHHPHALPRVAHSPAAVSPSGTEDHPSS
ncbi:MULTISPECIES: mechanosensitive ion channel family protein [unclassified Streptomyces]|uniref:mechanosensitive ion channel family protein n=1 Tax=unclassified Streptomyces TaxID=2593676 RepID=UPI0019064D50|nr:MULTISPECIES: mechanosensitive ion channel domain-containing protein [unclassified Streptomyces]MCU4745047.1 mechanosensitive ion channel family protein [Streptomyces sp. G-5]QQN79984.1 mechanosensitive ion channel [Streptomyces sp. XC 2026]